MKPRRRQPLGLEQDYGERPTVGGVGVPLVRQGVTQADLDAFGWRCFRAGRREGYRLGWETMREQANARLRHLAYTSRLAGGHIYRRAALHVRTLDRPRIPEED